jgi:hypothetical protein
MEQAAEFAPDSGRASMAKKKRGPYSLTRGAIRKRDEHLRGGSGFASVKSQLKVAKKRAARGFVNPHRTRLLRDLKEFGAPDKTIENGAEVVFIRPVPQVRPVLGRGVVLCFPDKERKYVSIDRSKALRRQHEAKNIDCVEISDVAVAIFSWNTKKRGDSA